jgi:hypothetical protein
MSATVVTNGKLITATLPCPLEEFLVAQMLLPRDVPEDSDDHPPR